MPENARDRTGVLVRDFKPWSGDFQERDWIDGDELLGTVAGRVLCGKDVSFASIGEEVDASVEQLDPVGDGHAGSQQGREVLATEQRFLVAQHDDVVADSEFDVASARLVDEAAASLGVKFGGVDELLSSSEAVSGDSLPAAGRADVPQDWTAADELLGGHCSVSSASMGPWSR